MYSLSSHDASFFIPGRRVAAPSWIFSGTLAENCHFLSGKVDEIGLLFFETQSCLAYTEEDLPPSLATLPLTFHVHLPFDLPLDGEEAAYTADALMRKATYLKARRAVLHPCLLNDRLLFLRRFAKTWQQLGREPHDILVENIKGEDLVGLEPAIVECGMQVCLDIGHLLAYKQDTILSSSSLMKRVGMIHLNAPGVGEQKSRHYPLTGLQAHDSVLAGQACAFAPASAVVMLEMFSLEHILQSLPQARDWCARPTTCQPS